VPIDTGASFEAGLPVLEPLIGDFENLEGGNLDARRQRLDRGAGSSPAGARARTRAGERR
jgi:hypothetical protein